MLYVPAIFATDSYKLSHADQYPAGMSLLFSTWVPRSDRIARMSERQLDDCNEVVFFGIRAALAKIYETFDVWFKRPENEVVAEYVNFVRDFLKVEVDGERIRQLHRLGALPIRVLHLPEGTVTRTGVVQMVIYNVGDAQFAWVTNYLETLISTLLWKTQVNTTIARNYRKEGDYWADITCDDRAHVDWQFHDFSMRGLGNLEDAQSNLGHLLYFNGTDTLPAVFAGANLYEGFEVADYGSVPATEHSVMCAGGSDTELETFARLLATYPTGIVSVVSDTWDLWSVLTNILPALRDTIMGRDGKLVIRPDSGDPVDILCGDPKAVWGSPAYKGVVQLLDEAFGSTVNGKGFKVLDPHIGVIYGDSITLDRARRIFERLQAKGYAASNVVLGIGSYTYQCNTRDTWGFAMKATGAIIDGVEVALFKDPITDDGTKKSFRGFLTTVDDGSIFRTIDGLTFAEATDLSRSAFVDADDDVFSKWGEVKRRARAM